MQVVLRAAAGVMFLGLCAVGMRAYEPPPASAARVYTPAVFQAKQIPVYLNYAEEGMCYGNLRYTAFDLEKLEFILKEVIENHNAASVSHSQLTYAGTVCLTEPFPFTDDEPAALNGQMWFGLMEQWDATHTFEEAFPGIIVTAVSECPADFAGRITPDDLEELDKDVAWLRERTDVGGRHSRLTPTLEATDQAEAEANGWPMVPWGVVYLARVYDDDGTTICPRVDPGDLPRERTACSIDNPGVTVGDPCPMGVSVADEVETCDCWNPITDDADEDAGTHRCEAPPDDDEDMEADGNPRIGGCRCPMTGAKLFLDAPGVPDPALVTALAPAGGDPSSPLRCDVQLRNKSMTSTLAHELGHVLGLTHPDDDGGAGDAPDTSEELDAIMSYNRIYGNRAYDHSRFRRDDLQGLRYLVHDAPPNPAGAFSEPVLGENDWQEAFVVRWRSASVSIGGSPPIESSWNSPNTETGIAPIVAPTMSTGATRSPSESYPRILAIAWVDAERSVHVSTMGPSGLHSLPDTEIPSSNTPYRAAVALADPGIFAAWVTDPSIYGFERDIEWAMRPADTSEWDEWDSGSLATELTAYCTGLSPCPDDGYCVPNGQACEYQGALANLSGRVSVGYDQAQGEYLVAYAATGSDLTVVRISDVGEVLGWNVWNGGGERYVTHFSRPLCTTFTQSMVSSSVCNIVFVDNPRGDVRALQWAPDGTNGAFPNLNIVELGEKGVSGLELVGEGWAGSSEYSLFVRGQELGLDAYALTLETTSSTFPLQLPDGFIVVPRTGLADLDAEEEAVIPNWPPALGNRFSDDLNDTVYTVWAAAPPPDNDPGTPYGDTDTDGPWGSGASESCTCRTGDARPPFGAVLVGLLLAGAVRRRRPSAGRLRIAGCERAASIVPAATAVVLVASALLVACGPSTDTGREGLCGTAHRPQPETCGNSRSDPGELCFRSSSLELPADREWVRTMRILDVDGDDVVDVLLDVGSLADEYGAMSLFRGLGDGTFAARERSGLPLSGGFIEAPEGMAFDFLGASSIENDDNDRMRLVGYAARADGGFDATTLDERQATEATVGSIGVGLVDQSGRSRVYVRLDGIGQDYDVVYELHAETATSDPPVVGAEGQPRFPYRSAQGIWIADFDGDGREDALQLHALKKSHDQDLELDPPRFLEELHWLVDRGDVACEALDTMNRSYFFDTDRIDMVPATAESSVGRAIARLNADDAFDLLFTNDEGTFVAMGSLGPACVPMRTYSDSLEWPPCSELEFVAIEKLADEPWGVEVVDVDGDGRMDIVGLHDLEVEILLGAR